MTPELLTERAEHLVTAVAGVLGRPPKADYTAAEVVSFARDAGYQLDYQLLQHLIALGRVPGGRGGRYPAAVLGHVIAYLERHRLWAAGSLYHDAKKSRWRLEREELERCGEAMPGLSAVPLVALVMMVAAEPDAGTRDALSEVVLHKLHVLKTDVHA